MLRDPRPFPERPHVTQPRPSRHLSRRHLLLVGMLLLLLLAGVVGGWNVVLKSFAAPAARSGPGLTFQQFLKGQRNLAHVTTSPWLPPRGLKAPALPKTVHPHPTDYTHLPASAEPATMKPITVSLSAAFLSATSKSTPLDLMGSDHRLEVRMSAGSLDLSHVQVATGHAPVGGLSLHITQQHGHFLGETNWLGSYQVQLIDAQGHVVSQVSLRHPITFLYHYQLAELTNLNLDPGRLIMVWPSQSTQARPGATTPSIALHNDPKTHTLTGQSTQWGTQPLDEGGGLPQNQSPPVPHFASVSGNAGQLSYSYPLSLPPGAAGFAPQLALTYSSAEPNGRHSRQSPAGDEGDGWSLNLGSITADVYAAGSVTPGIWYSINGVDNISDKLAWPNTLGSVNNTFVTEHLSQLLIVGLNTGSNVTAHPCFHVWDPSGTYYEFGCTGDSVQYSTDGNGTIHYYRFDLDEIRAPNEHAGAYNLIKIAYDQDPVITGYETIQDAGIGSITYGYSSTSGPDTIDHVLGTVVFSYNTSTRADDPVAVNGIQPPAVMSSWALQSVTSYVGSGTGTPFSSYSFQYHDSTQTTCYDKYVSGQQESCAGEHQLTEIDPTMYQSGTGHTQKPITFSYSGPLADYYYDSGQVISDGITPYSVQTYWQYLTSYMDQNTGIGGSIQYQNAFSNTHGTPNASNGDDRYDPLYCTTHSDCTGNYLHPEDRAWSQQVVTQLSTSGSDSSALSAATTTYAYRLAKTSTYSPGSPYCYPAGTDQDCVGDNWTPYAYGTLDTDWMDYYHSEFRGFNMVYTLSPAGEVAGTAYYSTEGWNSHESDPPNYLAGYPYQQDQYQSYQSAAPPTPTYVLREATTSYAGNNTTHDSCNANYNHTYAPCEVMALSSATTSFEGINNTQINPSSLVQAYTYDDYNTSSGLDTTNTYYHGLLKDAISSSNASALTKKWSYASVNQTDGNGWTYYSVDHVTHSEVDDANHHVWGCQDLTYDEGAPSGVPTPDAGWVTTRKAYSNCANPTVATTFTSYQGYDGYGNVVATVDPVASSNSGFYSSSGCTPAVAPTILSSAWSKGTYTSCTNYDTEALPTKAINAFGQSTKTSYDHTQMWLSTSTTDANGQITSLSYTYDGNFGSNDKVTTKVSQPGETGSYTTKSYPSSQCNATSSEPCLSTSQVSSLSPTAYAQTFYDSLGREVETNTPIPTPVNGTVTAGQLYYRVTYTLYDDATHSTWQSLPFVVQGPASGLNWTEPNGATDYQGHAPNGTATYYDELGRIIAVQDPNFSAEANLPACGFSWSHFSTATTCSMYNLGTANGDSSTYDTVTVTDANGHVAMSYMDALGRTVYTQQYKGQVGSLTLVQQQQFQYNVLDEPTSVTVTDEAPRTSKGQTLTSVSTSASYDDLGRMSTLSDPDRGTHSYTYDADGRVITDVSGSRTLGTNYDLLGRVGCIQNTAPVLNATGACSAGNPLVQNTYDVSSLTVSGSTDYPVGHLTKSVATTRFDDGTNAKATSLFEYDQRARGSAQQLQLTTPSSWGVTTALPTYQMTLAYNDANQPTTLQSTVGGAAGETMTQVYDTGSTGSGGLLGLGSTTNTANANLATVAYQAQGLLDSMTYLTTTGSNLAQDQFGYDTNLRPLSTTATWKGGSGNPGGSSIFSESRSYDNVGNVVSLATSQAAVPGQSTSGGSETQNFCYDEQNRLVWAGNSGTQPPAGNGTCGSASLQSGLNGAGYSNAFVYTHLDQLLQGPANGGSTQMQYLYCQSGSPHQLSGLYSLGSTCSAKSGGMDTTGYDAWGEVVSRTYQGNSATLHYDVLGQFDEWNVSTSNHEWYVYDASGNRVLRRSTSGSTTTLTTYPFGSEEHSYSATGASQSDTYYYSLAGHLIGKFDGTSTQFFLTDALSSVLATINAVAGSASVQGNQVYGPYGTNRYTSGTIGTNKGFTGQYNDSLTGLDYYGARYYDPVSGVFLSADTVEGNLQGTNPYAYVKGNPETLNDPSGHCPWCIGAIVGAVVGAGIAYGTQVYNNYQNGSANPWTSNINWGAVGEGALGGALIGATLGAAAPAVAAGVTALAGGAGLSGAVALAYAADAVGPDVAAGGVAADTTNADAAATDSIAADTAAMANSSPAVANGGSILAKNDGVTTDGGSVLTKDDGITTDSSTTSVESQNTKAGLSIKHEDGNDNPLKGLQYTNKVYGQRGMPNKDFHTFPDIVDNYGGDGQVSSITGGDGAIRTKVEIQGWYSGKEGVFEYIIEPDGVTSNHRFFNPFRN